jgi:EEF1A lysine methyltransferase 4
MPNYGDPEYWEKRYEEQQGRTFDWLEDYQTLKPIIKELINLDGKILILGCGNAELGEEMYQDGYINIENIDISAVVIQQMKDRNIEKPGMNWSVMDVRDLKFPSNYFDLAIDKSTIDALLCGDKAYINVAKMTKEVQRVLKVGGAYMVISYGIPETRLDHFQWKHLHWDLSHQVLNEGTENPHYVYLCRKKEGADEICQQNWEEIEESLCEEDQAVQLEDDENIE